MEFRTPIRIPAFGFGIDHSVPGLAVGSCFAEEIAGRLARAKFPVVCNPFGVLYNPLSVAGMFRSLAGGRRYGRVDLVRNGELWDSFDHHGSFSDPDPDVVLERIARASAAGEGALHGAGYVIVTLGTAWVYERKADGAVVANCHRFPASEFVRRRLSVREVVEAFAPLLEKAPEGEDGRASGGCLGGKKVIFTVSPVRHLKDGLAENALSKATLLVAVHELTERYPDTVYFPAYEILTDDLRDYRFYAADMVHPSETAAEYVWQLFREAALSPAARALADRIGEIVRAAAHRPLRPDTEAARRFRRTYYEQARLLMQECPPVDMSAEMERFRE